LKFSLIPSNTLLNQLAVAVQQRRFRRFEGGLRTVQGIYWTIIDGVAALLELILGTHSRFFSKNISIIFTDMTTVITASPQCWWAIKKIKLYN